MVLPAHLVGPITLSKGLADTGSSVMDQIAFAITTPDSLAWRLTPSGSGTADSRACRRRERSASLVNRPTLNGHSTDTTAAGHGW